MIFFFKQKTAYEMRISDWSSNVCSSDLKERQNASSFHFLPSNVGAPLGRDPETRDSSYIGPGSTSPSVFFAPLRYSSQATSASTASPTHLPNCQFSDRTSVV